MSTFLDGKSRYTYVGMMHSRDDVHEVFDAIRTKFREIGGAEIKKLHTDGAQEYISLQKALRGTEGTSLSLRHTF